MAKQLDLFPDPLVTEYLRLTREEMPRLARGGRPDWPVQEDHCFQRIVLDHLCSGVWYDHLAKPAYKNMTQDQLQQAIGLCRRIISDDVDLKRLNQQSLMWRGKHC